MKFEIGDQVVDEDGCKGRVVIYYDDGDICEHENDAAHPNPKIIGGWQKKQKGEEHDLETNR